MERVTMDWWVPVRELKKFQNPFKQITWAGLNYPIGRHEVTEAIQNRHLHSEWEKHGPPWRPVHVQRVAYFVLNPWKSVIHATILRTRSGKSTTHPVWDGLHRLAAAIYRGDSLILVRVDGDLELAREVLRPSANDHNGPNVVRKIRGAYSTYS